MRIRAAARRRRPPMQGPGWQPGGRYGGDPKTRQHVRALQVCGTQTQTYKCTHIHMHVIIRTDTFTCAQARAYTHRHAHMSLTPEGMETRDWYPNIQWYRSAGFSHIHTPLHIHTCTQARTHARTHIRYACVCALKGQTVHPAQTT
jgi:hypothetical protein